MDDLQRHQKSAIQVASRAIRHLRTFQRHPCQERDMSDEELAALASELLDHLAKLLAAPRKAPPLPRPGSAAGAFVRARRSLLEIAPDRFRR